MKKINFLLLLTVLMLAGGLRFFKLNNSPRSLNWDETSLGYNAYSLLKTGKDEYGKVMPVSLRSFDDFKPAGYAYFAVPVIWIGGLSSLTTRLPSATMGLLLVVCVFVIASQLTKSTLVGVLAAAVIAFEPWSLHFSRIAFEANLGTVILYAGLANLFRSSRNPSRYKWGVIMLALSVYAYHAERIIAVPLLLIYTWLSWSSLREEVRRIWKWLIVCVGILWLPLFLSLLGDQVTARLTSTNIFKLWPFVPKEFNQWIYLPIYGLLWQLGGHFLAYFSPANLFVRGTIEPAQYVPFLGLFHYIELPFWMAGLWTLTKSNELKKWLVPILIMAPLPGVMTWNWFSVVRTLPLYPAFAVIVSVGAWVIFKHLPRIGKVGLFIPVTIIYLATVVFLANDELLYSPVVTYGEYQPGFENSVPFLNSISDKYSKVVIDSPHIAGYIFFLFYGKYDPRLYQSQAAHREKNSGVETYSFGKYEFRQIDWLKDRDSKNVLFMGPTPRLPDYEFGHSANTRIVRDFYDMFGYIDFRFVETD